MDDFVRMLAEPAREAAGEGALFEEVAVMPREPAARDGRFAREIFEADEGREGGGVRSAAEERDGGASAVQRIGDGGGPGLVAASNVAEAGAGDGDAGVHGRRGRQKAKGKRQKVRRERRATRIARGTPGPASLCSSCLCGEKRTHLGPQRRDEHRGGLRVSTILDSPGGAVNSGASGAIREVVWSRARSRGKVRVSLPRLLQGGWGARKFMRRASR